MARRAIFWRGLVEDHLLGSNDFGQLVALRAADVLMRPTKGKLSSLFVVEQGGLPLHAGVALRAAGDIRLGELLPVDILMAVLALSRRNLEIHVEQLGFKVRRLVAIDAGCRAMGPEQWELGFRVVEA